jgi:hypothetical protein
MPVPVLDAWGFGETEQKLRSESKLTRMREKYIAAQRKKDPSLYELEERF